MTTIVEERAEALTQGAAKRRPVPRKRHRLEALLCFVVLMLSWEGIIRAFAVPPYIFPAPLQVARALWNGVSSGSYLYHLGITMLEVLSGFAAGSLSGLVLGIVMALVPTVDRIVYPYVVAIQTVPKVAVAPLMIVWFGFGIESKVIIVAVTCMFPVLINTIVGMRATDSDRVNLVRAMCGSRMQIVRYIQLPSALPYIFAGLHTAIILAVIGAVVGEFVGAKSGMGVMILQANFSLDLAAVFALLLLLSVTGVCFNLLLRSIERRFCFWSGKATK
jgi:NitT/TauT family transport system permease protein